MPDRHASFAPLLVRALLGLWLSLGWPAGVAAQETPEFTPQERAYLAQAGTIRMCVDPDWAPFERINAQGRHEGIAADLVQKVAQRVGLRIELLPVKSWDESLAASRGGRCQIMSFLNQTPARDAWLIFTEPVFSDPNVIITREEHGPIDNLKLLRGERVALPRGTMVEERVRRDFPGLAVVLTESEPEAMRLVSERRAELTIRSLIVAADAIKKEGLFNLKVAGQLPEYTNQLRIGVLRSEPLLRAILDKGVATLSSQERQEILNRHAPISIEQRIDWARIYWLLASLVALSLLALYILHANRRLRRALAASQEARDALRLSEERHRLLADNATDVIWTMDLAGRFTYVSPSVERLRGYTVEEVMRQTLDQALTPASAAIASEALARTIAAIHAGQPVADFRAELEQPCKQGGTIWTEVTVTPIQDAQGKFVSLLGVTRDISERRRTEEGLRIAATAFESQDGMYVTDADTVILRVNRALTRLTGYSAAELIGQKPSILSSGRHDSSFYTALWQCVQQGGGWHGEVWDRHKDGSIYPAQLTISAVKNAHGEVSHYVATMHDITLRKRLEDEVHQLAFYDPLTRLPNRRLFHDRLEQAVARARRTQTRAALLFIDLDKFKPINDRYGHATGDRVLEAVARRIETCVRASDTVARMGGDEFLVLLPDLNDAGDARIVADKIRRELERPFLLPPQLSLQASASIGIAVYPEHAASGEDLLRLGDQAMYQAKHQGGSTAILCAPIPATGPASPPDPAAGALLRLSWKAGFACGHAAIDAEHRELFRLGNALLAAREETPAQFEAAFDALLTHVRAHFAHEESVLRTHAYPQLAEHAQLHQQLLTRAGELRRGATPSLGELVDFLVGEVVARHMLNEDRKFYPLFAATAAQQAEQALAD